MESTQHEKCFERNIIDMINDTLIKFIFIIRRSFRRKVEYNNM